MIQVKEKKTSLLSCEVVSIFSYVHLVCDFLSWVHFSVLTTYTRSRPEVRGNLAESSDELRY